MRDTQDVVSGARPSSRRALQVYLAVFMALSIAGWLPEIAGRLGASWVNADYSGLLHPSDTFGPASAFTDLTDFTQAMRHLSGTHLSGTQGPFPYPPAAAYLFAFFLRLFPHPAAAYLLAFALAVMFAAWTLYRNLGSVERALGTTAVLVTAVLGSPQIFAANRGNLEWINWALTASAVAAFTRRHYAMTAILLGLATSVKPFPAIFFALLLWRRRYVEVALGAAVTFATSLIALHALGPTMRAAADGVRDGWADYFRRYVLLIRPSQEFRFNHSILDAIKVLLWFVFDHQEYDPRQLTVGVAGVPWWARLDSWAHGIVFLSVLLVGWIFWRFREMPVLNGIFALSIAELLLPYSAAEYTLMLLYVPWGLLMIELTTHAGPRDSKLSYDEMLRLLIPCAALFTPFSFMGCLTGVGKTILLGYLFARICLIPLPSLFDRSAQATP